MEAEQPPVEERAQVQAEGVEDANDGVVDQGMERGQQEAVVQQIPGLQQQLQQQQQAQVQAGQQPLQIPGIPEEWLQAAGRELEGELDREHLINFVINNMIHSTNRVMELSDAERQQALAIKAAVQEDKDLMEVPDMRYAQLALIDGVDVERSLDRIRHFQLVKDEYKFEDSFEEGCRIMRAFFQKQPNTVLSVSYNAIDGNYVYIYDQTAFNPHIIQSDEDWRVAIGFCYYVFQAMSPDLYAIRQGCVFIGECDGYNWTMVNVETVRRFWDEVFSVYPIQIRELKCFHSGVVANMLLSLLKPFFPQNLQNRINLGCQFEGRLDKFYSIPTREIAAERILADIDSFLLRRYNHERGFIL